MAFKIRSIKFNFAMNLLLNASGVLFPLITFPIVSRALLADAYGLAGWGVSVASWVSLIAMLGVNRYGIREVAAARDDAAKLSKTTREIFGVTLISTAIVYICFIISIFLVAKFSANKALLFLNSATVICNTLGVGWFFQGIEQYSYITIRGIAIKVVCLIGIILLVHVPSDYMIYAALLVCANGLANLINFGYMRHILKQADTEAALPARPKLELAKHVKPLFTFFIIAAAISVYTALDTVMLGFLSTDAEVGYYVADINIKTAVAACISALSRVESVVRFCRPASDRS
ncbi:MAG: oligosaccharide flippase family protein, partial [Eggerthellaceae bacterium]|nr:oligosaccharide flippase family protein [Eggerthellaceae bacterium]